MRLSYSLSRLGAQGASREDMVGDKARKVYRGQSTVNFFYGPTIRILNFTEITVTRYMRKSRSEEKDSEFGVGQV